VHSKYESHARLSREHNWVDLFNEHRNLHIDNEKDILMNCKYHEESAVASISIC
jgi:hypothetical protein